MTTAIMFSHQNDAGSRVSNTQYWENLVLVVVLVSESKALYCVICRRKVSKSSLVVFKRKTVPLQLYLLFILNCSEKRMQTYNM